MYYAGWIALVAASLLASLIGFVWALRGGQFRDQTRARYLPLADNHPLPKMTRSEGARTPVPVYILGGVMLLVLAALIAPVILNLTR